MYSPIAFFLNISIIPKRINIIETNPMIILVLFIPNWSSGAPVIVAKFSWKLGINKMIDPKRAKAEKIICITEMVIIQAPN